MFGIRTPVKRSDDQNSQSPGNEEKAGPTLASQANAKKTDGTNDSQIPLGLTEKAGPSQLNKTFTPNVRRSIDKWEASKMETKPGKREANTDHTSPMARAGTAASQKPKSKVLSQESRVPTRRGSVEATGTSPKAVVYKTRTDEARVYHNKAKTYLSSSRNLKTDIKEGVTLAVERLYQIVKELEAELAKDRKRKGTKELTILGEKETQKEPEPEKERDDTLTLVKLEEHKKLIVENGRRIEELKGIILDQRETIERATYANVVTASQNASTAPRREALHSVVVSSKKEEETGEEIMEKVRKAMDAKEGWVQVERVRKARDRKIVMGCKTQEERRKIKERLEAAGDHLVVEEVRNRDPLLIMRDVLVVHSDEEVIRAFRNQNREVFLGLGDGEDRVAVKYRRRTRNPHTGHIILSVGPMIWRRAVEAQKIRIDLQRVRVEDQSPLVQCTRCLGYGHGKRFCKESVDLCSHCGGPHMRSECPDKITGEAPVCRNCNRAKMEKVDHNAFSSECPVRRKWDSIARASIAYC